MTSPRTSRHVHTATAMTAWLSALLIAGFAALPVWADQAATPEAGLTMDDFRSFTDAFSLIRQNHVDTQDDRDLLDAAIAGLVSELDPHSEYLSARDSQQTDNTNRGRYGGIGIEIDVRDQRIYVLEVVPGAPAEAQGVQVGDRVLAVDDVPVKGRDIDDSFRALHGPPGSEVTVRFGRSGRPARELQFVREFIPVDSVSGELLDARVARLNITHFHTRTAGDFRAELEQLTDAAGDQGLTGIVVDLRDNTGGVVSAATAIADGFLDEGLVVYTQGRYEPTRMEYFAEPGQWVPQVPVVILVNRMTASASEILAGALQDHDRARVVGETTYGKGTVQSMMQLRNGSALKLTTARFYTPSGQAIDQVGITPDEIVEVSEDGRDAVLDRAMELIDG